MVSGIKVASLEKENKDLRERVEKLEVKVEAAEQYSRCKCLRIAGVPENQAADTDAYVVGLSGAIGVEIALTDIERSHRVGNLTAGRTRDIIVKFALYRTRRMVYGARASTKDSGYVGVSCRGSTYISYKSEARTNPVMYHTAVVSGAVARLFRYEDMVMNHAFIVLVSEIYNTIYSPPTRMCCITSPNNDDDDDN